MVWTKGCSADQKLPVIRIRTPPKFLPLNYNATMLKKRDFDFGEHQ